MSVNPLHNTGRSKYVDDQTATNSIRDFAASGGSGGTHGLGSGGAGSSNISGQEYYDSFGKHFNEQIEAYVASGEFPAEINKWPAMADYLANKADPNYVPQWIKDLFDTPQGGSVPSGAIALPTSGPPLPKQALTPGPDIPLPLTPQGQPLPPVAFGPRWGVHRVTVL
jgi:hypothetical protein